MLAACWSRGGGERELQLCTEGMEEGVRRVSNVRRGIEGGGTHPLSPRCVTCGDTKALEQFNSESPQRHCKKQFFLTKLAVGLVPATVVQRHVPLVNWCRLTGVDQGQRCI